MVRLPASEIRLAAAAAASCLAFACSGTSGIVGNPDTRIDTVDMPLDDDGCGDGDGDTFPDEVCGGSDCDDTDPSVHPGAAEVCLDGVDQDCDGIVDGLAAIGDPHAVESSITGGDLRLLDFIANGDGYAILWAESTEVPATFKYFFHLLDNTGGGLGPPREIPFDGQISAGDAVARSPIGFGIVGLSNLHRDGIVVIPVDPEGEPSEYPRPLFPLGWGDPSIAWNGRDAFDIVIVSGGSGLDSICYATASANGEILGPATSVVHTATGMAAQGNPMLARTEDHLGVTWHGQSMDSSSIAFISITEGGTDHGDVLMLPDDGHSGPSHDIAWNGSNFAAMWTHPGGVSGSYEIMITIIDEIGSTSGPDVAIASEADCGGLDMAWSGSEYGLMWIAHGADIDLRFSIISYEGIMEREFEVPGTEAPFTGMALAWTGSEFGLSWDADEGGESKIFLARYGYCD